MNTIQERSEPKYSVAEWNLLKDQATTLIKSKFLPDHITTTEQVMIIGVQGKEMGIPLMAAIRGINVIKGKSSPSPQLKLALALRTKLVADLKVEVVGQRVNIAIKRKGFNNYIHTTFGDTEAKAMGLSVKDNYLKQPLTMYQWRAIDRALNVAFADVVLGVSNTDIEDIDIPLEDDTVEATNQSSTVNESSTITVGGQSLLVTAGKVTVSSELFPETNLVQDILEKLMAMNNGDKDSMEEHLRILTTWVDKKTGEELFLKTSDLETYAKKKPEWIKDLHRKVVEAHALRFSQR